MLVFRITPSWPSLFPARQSNRLGGANRGVTLDHGLLIPTPHTRTLERKRKGDLVYCIGQYGKLAFLLLRTRSISLSPAYCKAPAMGVLFYSPFSWQNWSSVKSNILHNPCTVCSFMFSCLRHWNTLWRLTFIKAARRLELMLFSSWAVIKHCPALVIISIPVLSLGRRAVPPVLHSPMVVCPLKALVP